MWPLSKTYDIVMNQNRAPYSQLILEFRVPDSVNHVRSIRFKFDVLNAKNDLKSYWIAINMRKQGRVHHCPLMLLEEKKSSQDLLVNSEIHERMLKGFETSSNEDEEEREMNVIIG